MKKEKGNVGDLMATGICILAMTSIMFSYLVHAGFLAQKIEISQIARKYILRMETVGMLTDEDRAALMDELGEAGATDLNLEGTTFVQVGYGEQVVLQLQGRLKGEYEFTEKRVSTAKH